MAIDHYVTRLAAAAVLVASAVLAGACGSNVAPTATAVPASAAVASARPSVDPDAWSFAAVVQPDEVTQAPSLEPGYHCSPCHPSAASQLFGMTATPSGFLGVGVQQPPAVAIAVSSPDGRTWQPVAWDPGERTTAVAAASAGDRTVVVGSGPAGASAWVLRGGSWTPASGDALQGEVGATAMTAVVASGDGFVAGGYRDDPLHARASAAAWSSEDGLTWQAEGPATAFPGARIDGMASRGDTVVAVGSAGDPTYGPAAAWGRTGGGGRRGARRAGARGRGAGA